MKRLQIMIDMGLRAMHFRTVVTRVRISTVRTKEIIKVPQRATSYSENQRLHYKAKKKFTLMSIYFNLMNRKSNFIFKTNSKFPSKYEKKTLKSKILASKYQPAAWPAQEAHFRQK